MYYLDNRRRHSPHVHARYQDEEAAVGIHDGAVLDGSLPANKMKLLQAWIEIHREELIADWALAAEGQQVFKIEPLR